MSNLHRRPILAVGGAANVGKSRHSNAETGTRYMVLFSQVEAGARLLDELFKSAPVPWYHQVSLNSLNHRSSEDDVLGQLTESFHAAERWIEKMVRDGRLDHVLPEGYGAETAAEAPADIKSWTWLGFEVRVEGNADYENERIEVIWKRVIRYRRRYYASHKRGRLP